MRRPGLAAGAWLLLGYTVMVILWGAYVRATGAGAGCGSHWPLCNGEIVPRSPGIDTVVELAHRLSSGLLGIFVLAFTVASFRATSRSHPLRRAASWSLFFVVAEALIGAGLVRFEWVADNDSQERAYVMAFHLVNTFLLLAAMTLAAWHASDRPRLSFRDRATLLPWLGLAFVALLVVGASGAVTALGDTLVLTAGLTPEESPLVARLVGSRFYHPTLALVAFGVVAAVVFLTRARSGAALNSYARPLVVLFGFQLLVGAVNVLLKAPVWMQLSHLLLSNLLWILLVLFAAVALSSNEHSPGRRL